MANIAGQKISGAVSATGVTGIFQPIANKPFNVEIFGTFVATVAVVRSFDNGVTWQPVLKPDVTTAASFTAPANYVAFEPDASVLWALSVTWTSGTSVQFNIGS